MTTLCPTQERINKLHDAIVKAKCVVREKEAELWHLITSICQHEWVDESFFDGHRNKNIDLVKCDKCGYNLQAKIENAPVRGR